MILRQTYFDPNSKNCEELVTYLKDIAGKPLAISCIRQNIFKIRWRNNKRDINLIIRCHLNATRIYLEYLIANSSGRDNQQEIKTLIADLIPIIEETDNNQDTSFILVSTNTQPSTIHYKNIQHLFYKNQLPKDTNRRYDIDILVIYGMRLALEQRLLGILGIDYIESSQGRPIGISSLLPIFKRIKNIEFYKEVKFEEIEWVWDWLNHHMHRHFRPYPWIIHQAFEVLNPLLLPSKVQAGNTVHHSIYASSSMVDWENTKAEIEGLILKKHPGARIRWGFKQELLKIRSSE